MAVSWSLVSYAKLSQCSKNPALQSGALFASPKRPATLTMGSSGPEEPPGTAGCRRDGWCASAIWRHCNWCETPSQQLSPVPVCRAGGVPATAALQLRGLTLPEPGTEPPASRLRAELGKQHFISPGAALRPQQHLCPFQSLSLCLKPVFIMAQLPPCGCSWLLISCCEQHHSNWGVLRKKGLLPLYLVSLHYQDFSRSSEQSRNYRWTPGMAT